MLSSIGAKLTVKPELFGAIQPTDDNDSGISSMGDVNFSATVKLKLVEAIDGVFD